MRLFRQETLAARQNDDREDSAEAEERGTTGDHRFIVIPPNHWHHRRGPG